MRSSRGIHPVPRSAVLLVHRQGHLPRVHERYVPYWQLTGYRYAY
jgi:hypothetical protein